ncbi:MAG: methyltransferase domain-containing protein [Gammaproteobacteria bacterium]|nr:methyltransferase domain-containing protein [Gammaproteobacteria bacterium]
MDRWKYFGITHRDHVVCNPTSSAKLDELVDLLPLHPKSRVLDIACGKAELLLRIAAHHDATGVGVDISPYEFEAAKRNVVDRKLESRIEIVEMDGAEYDAAAGSFDMAMCIGATWVWGGYLGTIEALKKIVVPGGLIAIGEPFKMQEPHADYVAAEPDFVPTLVTHAENVAIAQDAGLTLLYALVSNPDDWDRYEGLQTRAAVVYATEHPEDPDVDELLRQRREVDAVHLRWARDTLNWAIYLFKAPLR